MSEDPFSAASTASEPGPGPELPVPGARPGDAAPVMPPPPVPTHTGSLLLAILSGLGLLLAVVVAAALILLGLGSLASSGASLENAGVLLSFGFISLLVAAIQLPALVLSIRRLSGRPPVAFVRFPRPWVAATAALALVIPLVLFGQSLADSISPGSMIILPLLQVVVVAVPVWWVLETGRYGLGSTGAQRSWGIASVGTLVTMPLIIILEGMAIFIGILLGYSWLSTHPQAFQEIQALFRAMSGSGISPEQASQMLGPLLSQPPVIFLFFLYLSVIGPLVEETFKPLAMWFLAGRNLTPAQGFKFGMMCGATFALLESLSNIFPALGSDWAGTVAVRVVAALLHITFSGLVGWGLAMAWRNGKYVRLAGLFLLAVFLHGLWNGVSLLSGLSPLLNPAQYGVLVWLGQYANVFMIVLSAVILALLLGVNRYLRTHPDQDAPVPAGNSADQTQLTTENTEAQRNT